MCTAITYKTRDHYFGRNLDYEHDFGEEIIITPRNKPLCFVNKPTLSTHYAIIGIGINSKNYPLYFDATNELGLSIAGLNFPHHAYYFDHKAGIAPHEIALWLLAQCKTVDECVKLLQNQYIINQPFSKEYPLTPLHWMLADKQHTLVLEPTNSGLQIHSNPIGVLTNSPPFDYHIYNLSNYMNITAKQAENRFAPKEQIIAQSQGIGGIGLPGDNSSASRFIRAAFTKLNSKADSDELSSVSQFFHILNSVYQVNGCTQVGNGFEKTLYSSCCNTDKGIYYYTTYENSQITSVDMRDHSLDTNELITFPLKRKLHILNAL